MTGRYWVGIAVFSLYPTPRALSCAAARLLISAIFALAVNILADLIRGDYPLQERGSLFNSARSRNPGAAAPTDLAETFLAAE